MEQTMDWREAGKKIYNARIKRGLTQEELAEKIGVTPASISYYESGKKRPSFEKIKKICLELNLDIAAL